MILVLNRADLPAMLSAVQSEAAASPAFTAVLRQAAQHVVESKIQLGLVPCTRLTRAAASVIHGATLWSWRAVCRVVSCKGDGRLVRSDFFRWTATETLLGAFSLNQAPATRQDSGH